MRAERQLCARSARLPFCLQRGNLMMQRMQLAAYAAAGKPVLLWIMVFLSCSVIGCGNAGRQEYEANTDPDLQEINSAVSLDFEMEDAYDNLFAETELLTYPRDAEKIFYTIENRNTGKGFFYFSVPFIEYKDNGSWVRLAYYPPDYNEEGGRWYVCGVEGNRDISYSCRGVFYPEYVLNEIEEGEYRLVLFVGDRKIYAEFEFRD